MRILKSLQHFQDFIYGQCGMRRMIVNPLKITVRFVFYVLGHVGGHFREQIVLWDATLVDVGRRSHPTDVADLVDSQN